MPLIVRFIRDRPIGQKLGVSILGSLVLLGGVAWYALDRMEAMGLLHDDVAAQVLAERRVRESVPAAMELRVVSEGLPLRQTVAQVTAARERAQQQHSLARGGMTRAREGAANEADRALLDQAIASLDATLEVVERQAALRREMVTGRQKNLFLARATFESALNTLAAEVAAGSTLRTGVESVREGSAIASAEGTGAGTRELAAYRLAMSRVIAGAVMFMATANGAAANDVRESAALAEQSMAALLASEAPGTVKASAGVAATLGRGINRAALDLLDQTQKLETLRTEDVARTSQAMQSAVDAVARSFGARAGAAFTLAAREREDAAWTMTRFIAGVAVLMAFLGVVSARLIAGPIGRLTREIQAIADGETARPVAGTDRGDEVGRMAKAVERLRGVMRQAFVQARMIQEIPVGVMTAEAGGEHRIQYMNDEAKRLMGLIAAHLPVPPGGLEGQPLAVFEKASGQALIVTDPASLPHRARLTLGGETLELEISALHDPHGAPVGPMVIWHHLTARTRLAERFERSIGAIAGAVGEAAAGMRDAARSMSDSAGEAGERTLAVTTASEQASGHVAAAAAGAEELAASVSEIGRQVAESARIAARAVAEARATDQSVGGLSEAAGKIGAVVELIGDIAARTNLLALNATIEAARAGEAGKGFAVVASEVKTLATQTAKATEGIAAQIASMRDATGQAAAALRGIGETIQRMNEIAVAIAGAVEEQGAATQDIARAVQEAVQGTAEVNGNIGVVSGAVADTGQRAGAVLRAATDLTGQADGLKQEVARFLDDMRRAA